jgi:hypothetical protein
MNTLAKSHLLFLLSFALLTSLMAGCASKPPVVQPPTQFQRQGWISNFTNDDWRAVLTKIVTPGGYVRWDVLQRDGSLRDELSRYISLIGQISPVNRPDLFQTKADRLAYWINAYNAACIYGVLQRGLNNPPALYSMDLFSFGGVPLTLDQVEEKEIKPIGDVRAVFGINRCTHSSPPLRKEPYDGLKLGVQLVDQGKTFLNDSRGVVRLNDDVAKVSDLLAINYAPEFLAAYQQKFGKQGTLLQAIEPYATKHSLLTGAQNVVPMGYDASLNRP